MQKIDIPGFGKFTLQHTVFDYNGTLALDGIPEKNVVNQLEDLSGILKVHILTADTFGKVKQELGKYPFEIQILTPGNEKEQKKDYVRKLNPATVVSFGNGNNDTEMLRVSALGIGIVGKEGMSGKVVQNCDIIVGNINEAIDLLFNPLRIKATLRS